MEIEAVKLLDEASKENWGEELTPLAIWWRFSLFPLFWLEYWSDGWCTGAFLWCWGHLENKGLGRKMVEKRGDVLLVAVTFHGTSSVYRHLWTSWWIRDNKPVVGGGICVICIWTEFLSGKSSVPPNSFISYKCVKQTWSFPQYSTHTRPLTWSSASSPFVNQGITVRFSFIHISASNSLYNLDIFDSSFSWIYFQFLTQGTRGLYGASSSGSPILPPHRKLRIPCSHTERSLLAGDQWRIHARASHVSEHLITVGDIFSWKECDHIKMKLQQSLTKMEAIFKPGFWKWYALV